MSQRYELDLWIGETIDPARTLKIESSSPLVGSGFVELLQDAMSSNEIPFVACALFYSVAPDGHLHCCDVECDISCVPVSHQEGR